MIPSPLSVSSLPEKRRLSARIFVGGSCIASSLESHARVARYLASVLSPSCQWVHERPESKEFAPQLYDEDQWPTQLTLFRDPNGKQFESWRTVEAMVRMAEWERRRKVAKRVAKDDPSAKSHDSSEEQRENRRLQEENTSLRAQLAEMKVQMNTEV